MNKNAVGCSFLAAATLSNPGRTEEKEDRLG